MIIATWNVNSVKARIGHLCDWLRSTAPDVVLLQELKCEDAAFPRMEIEDLGYNIALYGQKTYNGVAILSKHLLSDVSRGIPDFEDEQSRYIEGVISVGQSVIRVASIYVPNGQDPQSDKFEYKKRFLDALAKHTQSLLLERELAVLGGDYNIAPRALDVYDPKSLDGTVCFHPEERARLRTIVNQGWYDAFETLNPNTQQFSWWDYRGQGYAAGHGLRIDHLLASPKAMDKSSRAWADETPRGWDKPSDHAPVLVEIKL